MFGGSSKNKSLPSPPQDKDKKQANGKSGKIDEELEAGVLQVANELGGESSFAAGVASSADHRNIKFKTAKKLGKGQYYAKLMEETKQSRFVVSIRF